jgi:hypothetical protein
MRTIALIATVIVLAGCASAPTGPSVMVLPGNGKTAAQFQTDDAKCRQMASGELTATPRGNVSDQRRYDMAYLQCMYAEGHQIPVSGRPGYSSPSGSAPATSTTISAPPAAPPGTPPPPPSGTPPPPPPPSR